MGRPRKNVKQTVKIMDENDQIVEVAEVGIPGLFQPQQWDIEEEFQNNEALREHRLARDTSIW